MICRLSSPLFQLELYNILRFLFFTRLIYLQQNDTLILEELVGDRLEEEEEQRGETLAREEQEVSWWGYRGACGTI